jgi:hypothetical protein
MSSFAYGRLTRERERFSPTRQQQAFDAATQPPEVQALVTATLEDAPEAKRRALALPLDAGPAAGLPAKRLEAPARPSVGTYVDAMSAIVPAEALAFYAAATSFSGMITTRETVENGVTVQSSTVANVDGAVWLIVLAMICSIALFVIGKFGDPWNKLDYLRAVIPAGAFMLWLVLQEQSIYWMLWDRSSELPSWTWLDNLSWNAYIVKITAVFMAVVLPLLAGVLGIKAERDDPVPDSGQSKDAVGGNNHGGAPAP